MSYLRSLFICAALAALCVLVTATAGVSNQITELEQQLRLALQQGNYARIAEIKTELESLYAAQLADDGVRTRNPLDQGGEDCESAVLIPSIPFCDVGTTTGMRGDYIGNCGASAAPDAVYRYVTTHAEQVTFSLCGSSYDTYLHVWMGCPTAGGVIVGCNDDFCGSQSCLTVGLIGDQEYFVIVDGYGTNAGAYRFNAVPAALGCVSTSCGWTNDNCTDATRLTAPAHVSGSTIGATIDAPTDNENCSPPDGPGVWYKFAGQDSIVRVQLSSPTVPHRLFFYCGCCTDLWCVLDPGCGDTDISLAVEAGVTYWLLVAGCDGAQGDFALDLTYLAPASNGGCGDPLEHDFAAPGEVVGNTCGNCNWCGLRPSEDALARVLIPTDGFWVFSLCESNFDTYLFIGDQPCNGNLYARDDTCGLQSTTPCLFLTAGVYFVNIEAWSSTQCGNYTLRVNACPMPAPLRLVIAEHHPDIYLHWDAPDAAVRNYKVFRSLDPEQVVLPANQIAVTADTFYVDPGVLLLETDRYHYAVTAFAP